MRTARIASTMHDAGGAWVRSLVHFSYDSVVTGPTGKTISLDAHQNAEFTPQGINTLTGQGPNVRAPGHGLLYQDVGRLSFDDSEWALLPCSPSTAPQSTERR